LWLHFFLNYSNLQAFSLGTVMTSPASAKHIVNFRDALVTFIDKSEVKVIKL